MRPSSPSLLELAERIRVLEAERRAHSESSIPLGGLGLEELFPERRLPGGSVVELLSEAAGAGAWTLAMALARQACAEGKGLVVADAEHSFYPPAAAWWGIDLERTLLVRPRTAQAALAAVAQSLRSSALGAAVGWFGRIASVDFRRLQLAAETGGGLGLLLRPVEMRNQPSFAAVRLAVAPLPSRQGRRRFRVETIRLRCCEAGRTLILETDDETNALRASAGLAAATPAARTAAAAG